MFTMNFTWEEARLGMQGPENYAGSTSEYPGDNSTYKWYNTGTLLNFSDQITTNAAEQKRLQVLNFDLN